MTHSLPCEVGEGWGGVRAQRARTTRCRHACRRQQSCRLGCKPQHRHAHVASHVGVCTLIDPHHLLRKRGRTQRWRLPAALSVPKGTESLFFAAQRKVTQRKGLKGSRPGRDTSPNVFVDTESRSSRVIRSGYSARRRGAEGSKQASAFGGFALSPQRHGASRYRDKVEAGGPTLIAMPQTFWLVIRLAP